MRDLSIPFKAFFFILSVCWKFHFPLLDLKPISLLLQQFSLQFEIDLLDYLRNLSGRFLKTWKDGAQTSLYLALSTDVKGVSGVYFSVCPHDFNYQLARKYRRIGMNVL